LTIGLNIKGLVIRSRLKDNGLYETSRMIMPVHREHGWLSASNRRDVASQIWTIRKCNGSVN